MNNPRVEALYYKITHAEDVVYEGVQPRNYETPNFSIRLEKDMAEIILKTDHQRVNDAQDEIEPFLRVWELTAALEFEPGFKFQYQRATGVDRNIRVEVADHALATATSKEQPVRSRYPDPPCTSLERDEA